MSRTHNASAKRRYKRRKRSLGETSLILVSLIDIMTNLVIYLMFSSSGVETLPNPQAITLPESYATKKPEEAYVVTITRDEVIFGDQKIVSLKQLEQATARGMAPLVAALEKLPKRKNKDGDLSRGEVNILADKSTPYTVLKRIMQTCSDASFEKISLAVNENGKTP